MFIERNLNLQYFLVFDEVSQAVEGLSVQVVLDVGGCDGHVLHELFSDAAFFEEVVNLVVESGVHRVHVHHVREIRVVTSHLKYILVYDFSL